MIARKILLIFSEIIVLFYYSTMSTKSRSLSNSAEQTKPKMQIQTIEDMITNFLKRKFRTSKSYSTINTYKGSLNRFLEFIRIKYNADAAQLLHQIRDKTLDALDVLDVKDEIV